MKIDARDQQPTRPMYICSVKAQLSRPIHPGQFQNPSPIWRPREFHRLGIRPLLRRRHPDPRLLSARSTFPAPPRPAVARSRIRHGWALLLTADALSNWHAWVLRCVVSFLAVAQVRTSTSRSYGGGSSPTWCGSCSACAAGSTGSNRPSSASQGPLAPTRPAASATRPSR
jgi:hypothetical protein